MNMTETQNGARSKSRQSAPRNTDGDRQRSIVPDDEKFLMPRRTAVRYTIR